jgi:hypothetical protein
MKRPKSIYKASEQGWQYCENCKKETWHTPKLGLVFMNMRKCQACNAVNKLIEIVKTNE